MRRDVLLEMQQLEAEVRQLKAENERLRDQLAIRKAIAPAGGEGPL